MTEDELDGLTNLARAIASVRPTWMDGAECVERDDIDFFSNVKSRVKRAIETCGGCRVKDVCREYAHKHRIEFGVWGGQTEGERMAELETADG